MNELQMYWWRDAPNFGDTISPKIVSVITGRKPVWSSKPGGRLFALGSINAKASPGDIIWGSGGGYDKKKHQWDASKIKVLACRGPLSRQIVLNYGGSSPEVYGDPGLLLPRLYPTEAKPLREVVIMPHLDDDSLWNYGHKHGIPTINPKWNWKHIVNEICSSAHLITSTLHGLIAAEAYGVPVTWSTIKFKTICEPKFHDYWLGCGREAIDWIPAEEALKRKPEPIKQEVPAGLVEALLDWLPKV